MGERTCSTDAGKTGRVGTRGPIPSPIAERIAQRVAPGPGGCLLWTGPLDRKGYGHINVGSMADGTRRPQPAHRAAWEAEFGPITDPRLCVCHACDTPACVNTDHLLLGTRAANNRDMFGKGRGVSLFAVAAEQGWHPRWSPR